MISVPRIFQPKIRVEYPRHNWTIFEQWLIENLSHENYLPINWCGFFVNNDYGNNKRAMFQLQKFINTLDPNKPMFTVTQYDLGVLTDISKLNIKVFGSGGGRIDFPLPLICHPHGKKENKRDIFASFIGSKTHPIRNKLIETYSDHNGWVVTDLHYDIDTFCDVLSRSIFCLCPRGFGLTSFRICEALEQQSIPVYISDEWIQPGNVDFNEYGVLVHADEIDELDAILANISPAQIESKREAGRYYYENMYTFKGAKQLILDNI
jgi:hypothetical protein